MEPIILIHGGAGTIRRDEMTSEREAAYRAGLENAVLAGQRVLRAGGSALEAVTAAVLRLEDEPLFNAGRGATLTASGQAELDASVMEGTTRRAGAVAGLRRVRNPILAARAVMERTKHLMLIGPAADALADEAGLTMVEPDYFVTPHRQAQLAAAIEAGRVALDHDLPAASRMGTVGAVAIDRDGHLAAATSTGGMTNKRDGRVGDSPIIGAGTWAEDATCAVSCTGQGEAFMRCAAAHEVASLIRYRGLTAQEAAEEVILRQVPANGGSGGMIVIDAQGRPGIAIGTEGMYRALARGEAAPEIAIFRDPAG
ncbi:isoaspartyl peptidase/L-asparaginase family protein [Roseomonas elaeocarpi]|uniref:Isoaspartyl peptidase/L-asparaginase family protein n=1 Tax=Roseomonas elaeocarpi TaxID=907779 RepID=A0ABV6JML8_9PROT